MSNERMQGVTKWFDSKKGFGFIAANGKDYFVHFRAIQGNGYKELHEGQHVSFVAKRGDKGMMADEVQVADAH